MSVSDSWDRETLPEALYVADDGRSVLLPSGATTRHEPTPRLSAEVALWARPPATYSFPFHPVGAAELVRRADEFLEQTGALVGLSEDDIELLGRQLWACAHGLFAPGAVVRTAIEAFVSSKSKYLPDLAAYTAPGERARAKGVAVLAAWAVVRGACQWVEESA